MRPNHAARQEPERELQAQIRRWKDLGQCMDPLPMLTLGARSPHDSLYFEFGAHTALRKGDWKIVREQPDQAWQLFDLASAHPERVAELEAALHRWKDTSNRESQPGGAVSKAPSRAGPFKWKLSDPLKPEARARGWRRRDCAAVRTLLATLTLPTWTRCSRSCPGTDL